MPLYQPGRREAAGRVDPALKAVIVHAFLEDVQRYTDEMIAAKRKRLAEGAAEDHLKTARTLLEWLQYRRFNRIALEEIEDGTLDPWFERLLK